VRGFPFSAPEQWISLCDEGGHEVLCLTDGPSLTVRRATNLPPSWLGASSSAHPARPARVAGGAASQWFVNTDRGDTNFELPSEGQHPSTWAATALC